MKRTILLFTAFALLLAAGITVFAGCSPEDFTGSRVKNPDAYLLDIERMQGTDSHTLSLQAGDTLRVELQVEEGALSLDILSPDGVSIYSGNGKGASDFTVNITESGAYTIAVEAQRAKGMLHFRAERP